MFESQTKTLEWSPCPYLKSSISIFRIGCFHPCQTNIFSKTCEFDHGTTQTGSWHRIASFALDHTSTFLGHPIHIRRPYFPVIDEKSTVHGFDTAVITVERVDHSNLSHDHRIAMDIDMNAMTGATSAR